MQLLVNNGFTYLKRKKNLERNIADGKRDTDTNTATDSKFLLNKKIMLFKTVVASSKIMCSVRHLLLKNGKNSQTRLF